MLSGASTDYTAFAAWVDGALVSVDGADEVPPLPKEDEGNDAERDFTDPRGSRAPGLLGGHDLPHAARRNGTRGLGESGDLVLPSPGDPMAVARHFVADRHTHDGSLLLRRHRGGFHSWNGTCWPELDAKAIEAHLYNYTENAYWWKPSTKKPGEFELVEWAPNRHKIGDLSEALEAVTIYR